MKNFYLTILTICMVTPLLGQVTKVTGTISEKSTGLALIGVNVAIKDALEGTVSSSDGSFQLETSVPRPFWIVVSMIGYESREIEITRNGMALEVSLEDQVYLGEEVVVSASRIPENIMESPVSIEKLSGLDIQQTSTANFFDGLHQLKGVDMNVHSLTFRYPNTRGFTGEANMRMNQIIDGIENIPPGLSFSAGNIFGVSQLDIDNVELLVGASSALYGPGGVNGTLILTSTSGMQKHLTISWHLRSPGGTLWLLTGMPMICVTGITWMTQTAPGKTIRDMMV